MSLLPDPPPPPPHPIEPTPPEILQILPSSGWVAIRLLGEAPWYKAVPIVCWALYRVTDSDGTITAVGPMVPDEECICLSFADIDDSDDWYTWVLEAEVQARNKEFVYAARERRGY